MTLGVSLLLIAGACFILGAAISKRHPLSYAATTTTLSLWVGGLLSGLMALLILVRPIVALH
jgi:hypothetical protein